MARICNLPLSLHFQQYYLQLWRAKGILNVHGIPQERIIKSDMTIRNGIITFKANFTVLLADHNIPIPKVVHEKLASEIYVEVNGDLKPQ